ncbi:MAG: hypothetical protein WCK02_01665 [Bacteroidota bacterium]
MLEAIFTFIFELFTRILLNYPVAFIRWKIFNRKKTFEEVLLETDWNYGIAIISMIIIALLCYALLRTSH